MKRFVPTTEFAKCAALRGAVSAGLPVILLLLALGTCLVYRAANPGWVAFRRGMTQLGAGSISEARQSLLEARASGIQHPSLAAALARTYKAGGDAAAAIAALEEAATRDPSQIETAGMLAALYAEQNRIPEAIHCYLDLEGAGAALSPEASLHIAQLYRQERLFPEAESVYSRLAGGSGQAALRARLQLAESLASRGEHDQAIAMLRALLAGDPRNRSARILLARVLHWAGRNKESISEYQKLLNEK